MKNAKLILSTALAVGAILGIGAASAADLPARVYTKAPPPLVSAMYDWSGFYIGLNGGGGSSHMCWDITNNGGTPVSPPSSEGCHNATGGTVGEQVGYRWQASSWVFGVEAEGNWANFRGSNTNPLSAGFFNDQSKINAFGLFTGQVGYAVNNVLFYAKGGAAVVRDRYNNVVLVAFVPLPAGATFSDGTENRWGGVAGAGIEFGFAPNWSVAVEYDHMFMGTKNITLNLLPPVAGPPSSITSVRMSTSARCA